MLPTLSELLAAGAHFGHKKERSYPKSRKFTYTIRDSVYVIDLEKTVDSLEKAIKQLERWMQSGQTILFVGTKRQAKSAVKRTAEALNMPYVTERWLGGMLTNYETISKSLKQLEKLESLTKSEDFSKFTKKERIRIEEKIGRINSTFSGLRKMTKLPDALFIVDSAEENVAVSEARRMMIPVVAICDTNANPDLVNYPIPANDDSEKAVDLIMSTIEKSLKKEVVKDSKEEPAKVGLKEETKKEAESKESVVEKKEIKPKTKSKKGAKK